MSIREEFKFDGKDIESHMYNSAIDVAFNYFENQTCTNCKWYSFTEAEQPETILPSQCIETCGIYSDVVPELIDREGCNRWSKKDEETI